MLKEITVTDLRVVLLDWLLVLDFDSGAIADAALSFRVDALMSTVKI